jgi:hypothetical protein
MREGDRHSRRSLRRARTKTSGLRQLLLEARWLGPFKSEHALKPPMCDVNSRLHFAAGRPQRTSRLRRHHVTDSRGVQPLCCGLGARHGHVYQWTKQVASHFGPPSRGQLYIRWQDGRAGRHSFRYAAVARTWWRMVCGVDIGSPVWDTYQPPFTFTSTLYDVIVRRKRRNGELTKEEHA